MESIGVISPWAILKSTLPLKKYALMYDKIAIYYPVEKTTEEGFNLFYNSLKSSPEIAWLKEKNICEIISLSPIWEPFNYGIPRVNKLFTPNYEREEKELDKATKEKIDSEWYFLGSLLKPIMDHLNYIDSSQIELNSKNAVYNYPYSIKGGLEHVYNLELKENIDIKYEDILMLREELSMRHISTLFRYKYNMNIHPIQEYVKFPLDMLIKSNSDVYSIAMNRFPVPDENEPWEKIVEFLEDDDSKDAKYRLKNWANEVADGKYKVVELEEKIDYLLHEYQEHLRLHQMKTKFSTFETIIKGGLEVAENIAKAQFSKIADSIFSIRQQKTALLEAERNAPGRELAYIYKVQNRFGKN